MPRRPVQAQGKRGEPHPYHGGPGAAQVGEHHGAAGDAVQGRDPAHRRLARHVVQHLARDHDIDRARREGQGVPVGEDGREPRLPRGARGRRDALETDRGELDPVAPREPSSGHGYVSRASPHVEQRPRFPLPVSRLPKDPL